LVLGKSAALKVAASKVELIEHDKHCFLIYKLGYIEIGLYTYLIKESSINLLFGKIGGIL